MWLGFILELLWVSIAATQSNVFVYQQSAESAKAHRGESSNCTNEEFVLPLDHPLDLAQCEITVRVNKEWAKFGVPPHPCRLGVPRWFATPEPSLDCKKESVFSSGVCGHYYARHFWLDQEYDPKEFDRFQEECTWKWDIKIACEQGCGYTPLPEYSVARCHEFCPRFMKGVHNGR
jgi:hypothetical protein